jgi:hypothetical protein
MDRTEWFLAFITFLVAAIALETVSGATSPPFRGLAGGVALLVLYGLPVYVLAQTVRVRVVE